MKVIPPFSITSSNLTSSTVPEPSTGETLWVSGTTYTVNQEVIRTETHRKYIRTVAGGGTTPPETDLINWRDNGPTNRYAMFDQNRNLATDAGSGSMTVVIAPGKRFDSIAVLGVEAKTVHITVTKDGSTIFDSGIKNMSGRNTTTWYQYFFGEFSYIPSLILQNIPPVSGATVTITFSNDSGNAKCSTVVIGMGIYIGAIQYNAKSDALNFSKIERDDFGGSILVPRRSVPRTDQVVFANKEITNVIRKVRSDLNAKPALWCGLDDITDEYAEALLIFGIYKKFEIDVDHPTKTSVNLELEEV